EPVAGPEESALYQGERYGNFSYAIPVATGGRYTAVLRFAESWFGPGRPGGGGAGSRVFDVYCNGQPLLREFDVFKAGGGSLRQVKKVFRSLEPNAQGKLNFEFVPVRNYGMINAIEVTEERP
ncbi:MAG TPA: malectin domain-containing carbohydrate-binding protein, partial [Bryobacteraceae bacterium]|nr:malectin domain-containing carbohydrate-binding protein [Bryobacteraceae bacterium]